MRKKITRIVFFVLIATPLTMWIAWLLSPVHKMDILILDKTVLTSVAKEHNSLNWVLTYDKFKKGDGSFYEVENDYYGFFPGGNRKYTLRGLEKMSDASLEVLAGKYEMTYFTDTYGIYYEDWFNAKPSLERSPLIYGGLSHKDVDFLDKMKRKGKLIIAEFNFFASPTTYPVRRRAEALFGLRWSEWTGRYFDSLDTLANKELPQWMIRNYLKQYGGSWPFRKAGIVFVNNDDRIVILENEWHLKNEIPVIHVAGKARRLFSLPRQVVYPFWFDITYNTGNNEMLAYYKISTLPAGDSILHRFNIPNTFPALLEYKGTDYRFFYLAGDFSDNPDRFHILARMKGIKYIKAFFNDPDYVGDRDPFFWEFYDPLVRGILYEYYASVVPESAPSNDGAPSDTDSLLQVNTGKDSVFSGSYYKVVRDTFHIIKKGETLYYLAKLYRMPLDELMRKNNLKKPNIKIGQKLKIR